MKLVVLQENLHAALSAVYKAVPSNPQLPILGSFLVSISPSSMTIAATDLYLGITSEVPVQAEEELKVALPAKTFFDIIHSLQPGKLELLFEESSVRIKSDSSTTKITVSAADEYPDFPQVSGQTLLFTRYQLEQIVEFVCFSASSDQARLVLTSVSIKPKAENVLEIVATDGFRLSVFTLETVHSLTEPLFIAAKAFQEITRIAKQLNQDEVTIIFSATDKQAVVKIASTNVFIRLIDGDYPPYEKILPTTVTTTAELDASALVTQVKRALVVAREVSNIITLQFETEKVLIQAQSSLSGSHQGEMSLDVLTGPTLSIAFNATYLLDFIAHVKPKKIILEMTEPLKPAVFKDAENSALSYLVMPFRTNS